jgi:hypothetical protein
MLENVNPKDQAAAPVPTLAKLQRTNRRRIIEMAAVLLIPAGIVGFIAWYYLSGAGYWDGGEFVGQPVYSSQYGISRTLHFEFQACGLEDKDIEDFARADFYRQTILKINPTNGKTQSIVLSAEAPTLGVYKVMCTIEP